MAAEIACDRPPKSDARDVTIEVTNEHHQRVLTVRVLLEVERWIRRRSHRTETTLPGLAARLLVLDGCLDIH
ncbi:DUF6894 family protein [Microvirga massiliensis]|uniref:DUF6894 family protein n=1 Tax=Microvirga massiliensis TaxID=1033741 RepID=UPI0011C9614C|nr:hypothetical protein [Microvirga massiliensis]